MRQSLSDALEKMPQWHPSVGEPKSPTVDDPRWADWCVPLLEFLSDPQEWPAINRWCRTTRFGGVKIRHCIAWLEEKRLAFSYVIDGRVVWVSMAERVKLL